MSILITARTTGWLTRVRLAGSIGTATLAFLIAATASAAAKLPPPSDDPQDLQGIWYKGPPKDARRGGQYRPSGELPFNEAGAKIYDYRRKKESEAEPVIDPTGECIPSGLPRTNMNRAPFQIVQTPKELIILWDGMREARTIYMNEKQPAHLSPTWMGHSVGHWEGDTLVIDTVGLRENWTDWDGAPVSTKNHVVERVRKTNGGRELEVVMTIDDPQYYTKPWSITAEYDWAPEAYLIEAVCEEGVDVTEPGWKWTNTYRERK